ncbi:MAG: AAA family ATPase [Haloarculaceae archaeon]
MSSGASEDADVESVALTVRGAEKRDAGRGIARLAEDARRALGVLSGDTVVVAGERPTVAKVWPGTESGVVRIDAETRASAGLTVGDTVHVRPVSVSTADAVSVEPADELHVSDPAAAVERALLDRPLRAGDRLRLDPGGVRATVTATEPEGVVRVTESTRVDVLAPASEAATSESDDETPSETSEPPTTTTYEDIGGLDEELDQVRETVELPLAQPDLFRKLGIDAPKGVLLYGPPGTGKTLIARAVASEVDAHFLTISGPEVVSKYKGESEERLRAVFEEAAENAPAVVFIDELDSIAGERDDEGDMENRLVAQLLTLLDGLEARGEVVVVGATNRVDAIDPALRRPGRFDREIEIGPPDEGGRREILDVHTRGMALADDVDLDRIAARTGGFVGADVDALATEAAMHALRERDSRDELTVTRADFDAALATVDPSAMREHVAESPDVTFEDVGGLDEPKATLREAVEWPLSYGALYDATATDPPSGVLLYGPPGTGKTLLARAVAGETDVNVIHVAGPELLDKYVGESEGAVREVFERARQAAPAVVFFDEIDAIAGVRGEGTTEATERVVSQLLTELDRLADTPTVVALAATNRREALDPALLRPGRFEAHVEVPPPDEAARRDILAVHTAEKPLAPEVDLDELAAETDGYTGADLEALVRAASLRAIRETARDVAPEEATAVAGDVTIDRRHFEAALDAIAGGRQD